MNTKAAKTLMIIICLFAMLGLATAISHACGEDYQENDTVPNLETQFLNLQRHGDALAFRRGAGDHPKLCKHYQGISRSKGFGTPYLYLSRSGIHTIGCPGEADNPGELLIVEMGSRNKLGERFGSNRLKKDISLDDYAPPEQDRGVYSYHFGIYKDKNNVVWPRYTHPGSMQLIGDVLIVALEKSCKVDFSGDPNNEAEMICPPTLLPPFTNIEPTTGIAFINVADPAAPYLIAYKEIPELYGEGLGVVGATHIIPDGSIPGMYLFVLTWGNSSKIKFAVANVDNLNNITAADITVGGEWEEDFLGGDKGKWRNWQTLQFLRNENSSNPNDLYLLGAEKAAGSTSKDWIALFKFHLDKLLDEDILNNVDIIEYKYEKHMQLSEPDMGSLDAASTFHVSPTGQLILYSTSHDSKGDAKDDFGNEIESIPMGEFRSIFVSHTMTCGPQWRGNDSGKHLCVPDSITERESLDIDGTVYFIEPWVHLFEDKLEPFNSSGISLMMDYRSQTLDNFDDLDKFKFSGDDFKDDADAFTFCGVPGSTLILYTEPLFRGNSLTEEGDGLVKIVPDLGDYGPNHLNYHDDIESAAILWTPPEGPDYAWSLNDGAKGTISENGPTVTYTAGCGSYVDTLYMKYKNQDIWQAQTNITVTNAAPRIDALSVSSDMLVAGEPVTLSGQWSDTCADNAQVTVNWGDNTDEDVDSDNEGDFTFTHAYTFAGTYPIHVCVSDGEEQSCQDKTVTVHYDCSTAVPSRSEIWPPNHKMAGIEVRGVTDGIDNPLSITITDITQDEPLDAQGDGHTSPDGDGIDTDTAWIRAERSGTGNGRVYEIFFTADDGRGGACDGSVTVCVPHDKGKGGGCIQDGQVYDSITGDVISEPQQVEFDVKIDLEEDPIRICFISNQPLNSDPFVSFITGEGSLETGEGTDIPLGSAVAVSPEEDSCSASCYCVFYTADENDGEVEARIEEDPADPVIPDSPGSETANFVINGDHESATSFCIYNAVGGSGYLKGKKCNKKYASLEMDADTLDLKGAKDKKGKAKKLTNDDCVLVKIVDVDPESVVLPPDTKVTRICDVTLTDGVVVANGKNVTVTLDFELPAGWNKGEFEKNLQVLYYDESKWKSDGIDNDNLIVEWDSDTSGTVTFNTAHLTKFAATSKSTSSSGSSDNGTQSSSGGCSINANSHDSSLGSAIANMLILSLPLIILGIRRKITGLRNN